MLDFEGRVAIVTGAGQGMGEAHAKTLAARGARVIVNDVVQANAEAVVKAITDAGGTAVVDTHDVSTGGSEIVGTALDNFGRLDIVVANAGILRVGLFGEQPLEEFWKVFDVSFKGTVEMLHAAWPHLVDSGSGRVILVSSSGLLANPGASAYGAAKAALFGLGNTLAMEGDRVGVQVTTIMPTAWTPMTENAYTDPTILSTLRDTMGPEYVSGFITWLAHQETTVHGDFFEIGGNHAGRLVLAGLPRVFSDDASAESWTEHAAALTSDSDDLEQFRITGDQFASEMIASNPAVKDALAGMNAADLGA
ncbi:SDR family NAD(P)-dependent oxidoreductase [Nocardioides sp. Kera G14]|uniref:SDR family NAD(P)-dependent oxidoreductase n=1 Tax=Nocardioides sp. Kera G14 TaxID=2884264 RepID=UPI001D0F9566|nr:SDR family NAD(P)-dependent oxidoreductase [Nocardioides sp. Kera G14]UDY24994.1 SDR family NAD(P)-dependent oxidoreductase [Nocardioides sp. Kera G14]